MSKGAMVTALLLATLARASAPAEDENAPHWHFAGMPLVNYASDTGLGLGVRGQAQRLGLNASPYLLSLEAQAYASTGGTQLHFLSVDIPDLAHTGWRLDALAGFWRNVAAHYYGIGDHPLLSEDQVDTFTETAPIGRMRGRHKLVRALSLQLGYRFMYQVIRPPSGSQLERDAPFGSNGGPFSELSAGLAWDTRDDELEPTRGVLLESSVRSTLRLLGSAGDSVGVFSSAAAYQPIARGWLIAARVAVDATWGDVPFNRLGDFGTMLSPFLVVGGVGGGLTVRGLLQSEYVGRLKLVSNLELRFPLFGFQFFGQRLSMTGVTFVDAGQVDGGAVHLGAGGGLRIRWGRFFIVRFDAGYSEDRVRFYADFGNVF